MPRIAAPTNAAQREQTQRKILNAFGELLFTHGLPGLTMTDVARTASVGRTAVYNYFADLEQLLVAYALDETGKFVIDLKAQLDGLENPVERLAVYVRAQLADLTRRHLPPGPAMRSVLSRESFEKLGVHVGELNSLLMDILRDGMDQRFLPKADVEGLVQLIHGSMTASASRRNSDTPDEEHINSAVRFIQAGVGASFDDEGRPLTLA